jgi:hypothetical protein
VAYNYCSNLVSCIIDEASNVHDNYIINIVNSYGGAHQNGIEINYSAANSVLYNNYICAVNVGLALWQAPESSTTAYAFNNLVCNQIYNSGTANTYDLAAALINPSGSVVAFNNTMECGPDGDTTAGHWNICAANIASSIAAVTLENNHWITLQTTPNNGVWSVSGSTPVTETTDLKQLPATATSQGYTLANNFAPTTGGSTIGAGTNASSICTTIAGINSAAGTACQSDTTLGVAYNATTHVATSPKRATNTRPASAAWDAGAFEFNSSTASNPSCTPTSGTVPQTVTCTNPNTGSTIMCYAVSPTVPATNGAGTGCNTGTQYTTALTISSPETLKIIAGVASESDSSVVSYTYTAATYTITVSSIVGHGTVTSSDSVLNCTTGTTGTCTDSTATGTITLTESPASGYSFTSWGGGTCSGSSSTCAVTTAATVTATFTANPVGKTAVTALLW